MILFGQYVAKSSHVPFIIIFLNKFLDNNFKGFLIDNWDDINDSDMSDNIDSDLDIELELLTRMNAVTTNMMLYIDQISPFNSN